MGSAARMAPMNVIRVGEGVYRVEHEDRQETVYVAGTPEDQWAFWNGHVFRGPGPIAATAPSGARSGAAPVVQFLTAPMPATVIKVLVTPGAKVRTGETVLLLEAMKMELPLRAPADATVTAVHCRQGDLVQPDVPLVEF